MLAKELRLVGLEKRSEGGGHIPQQFPVGSRAVCAMSFFAGLLTDQRICAGYRQAQGRAEVLTDSYSGRCRLQMPPNHLISLPILQGTAQNSRALYYKDTNTGSPILETAPTRGT